MEQEEQLKGVVIISLPPPESPSDGKTVYAAFTLRDHQQQQQHLPPVASRPQQQHQREIGTRRQELPLTMPPAHLGGLPAPWRLRRRRLRRIAGFLFAALLGFAIWLSAPSSFDWLDRDPKKEEQDRSMVYSLYSKADISADGSHHHRNSNSSSAPFISKLVVRDVVRNTQARDSLPSSTINTSAATVFPIRGNVYPHGLYFISVKVGNPARPFFLDVDTGSDLTWIQCDAPCRSCAKGPHALYKPRKPQIVPCNEAVCAAVQAGSKYGCADGSSQQCDYDIEYADGSSTMGVLVTDAISLLLTNGTLAQTKSVFGCSYDQQGSLAISPANTDGVLGLSTSRVSLPSQWTEQGLINNVFAHCIAGDGKGGGYLFFGDKLVPPWGMTWAPMLGKPSAKNYQLGLEKISFGDSVIEIDRKLLEGNAEMAIFDSGTSYTYLASQAYNAFVSAVLDSLSGSGLARDTTDQTLPFCWHGSTPIRSVEDVRHYFKSVTMDFKGGGWFPTTRKMQITPEGFLVVNSKGNVCLGVLDASALGDKSASIIGDISLQGHLVVYDNVNNRIGWMRMDCKRLPRAVSFASI